MKKTYTKPTLVKEQNAARLTISTKEALAQRLQLLVESRAASQNDLMVAHQEDLARARDAEAAVR